MRENAIKRKNKAECKNNKQTEKEHARAEEKNKVTFHPCFLCHEHFTDAHHNDILNRFPPETNACYEDTRIMFNNKWFGMFRTQAVCCSIIRLKHH